MTHRMKMRAAPALLVLALAATAARGESTPEPAACSAEALGTARVLPVDAATTPRVGRKHFHDTLPLAPKEVVLTFDDGPVPGTTARVLETLKRECAQAATASCTSFRRRSAKSGLAQVPGRPSRAVTGVINRPQQRPLRGH